MFLDKRKLTLALSEIDDISRRLPEASLVELAQEVVKRVANNLRPILTYEFAPTTEQVDALCEALLSGDPSAAIILIEGLQRGGAGYEALCQSYLAVAARRLGEWWEDDKVSFYQVTIAAGRIYAILRSLRSQRSAPTPDMGRSAIFVGTPGEDHTLGITIAADMARDRGWDIELFTGRSHDELVGELLQRDTTLIGLSASTKRAMPALLKLIVALRVTNPYARIMVCGLIAEWDINLGGVTGADATAGDFDSAFAYMEGLATGAR